MKYRKLTDLTDEEVKFIVNEIVKPEKILLIERNLESNYITVLEIQKWQFEDDDGSISFYEDEDELMLYESKLQADFSLTLEEKHLYLQYLLSKGCNYLFKDNPYIQNQRI